MKAFRLRGMDGFKVGDHVKITDKDIRFCGRSGEVINQIMGAYLIYFKEGDKELFLQDEFEVDKNLIVTGILTDL